MTSLVTIKLRQEAVQELLANDDLALTLAQVLSMFPKNLDQ